MNTPNAANMITTISKRYTELNVGAGTVCTTEELNIALDAGASFIVSPVINEKVIQYCLLKNIPVVPGAYTPTEIYNAWQMGVTAVKVFPVTALGVSYIKDILSPLPYIKLIPTGGVSLENVKAFFDAGAYGAGMGSSLFVPEMIEKKDYEGLSNHFLR
jgi:2-dehydro-3-deoxyphosphogluconate aldolase/(4S)-4-hydroxy-2-oxoglutarate aldolase